MNEFREVIQKVSRGEKLAKDLTREEAHQALLWIFDGKAGEFQIGAFFSAMRMKGESAEETAGLVEGVWERTHRLHEKPIEAVDLGDPYDGKVKTLNLSLPIALTLAVAGVSVVLHSTPETPVKKGVEIQSILEALGVRIPRQWQGGVTGPRLKEALEKEKIVFLPTEILVPDFAKLRPFREAFGLRPFANHIEKIFNLAHAATQMVGVYHRPYVEPMAGALGLLGTPRIFVIQGVEGFTELFVSRKTLVLKREGKQSETLWLDAAAHGMAGEEAPSPGKAPEHAARIRELLEGKDLPGRKSLLWNAGAKLFWMGKVNNLEAGLTLAREILDSGKALVKLEALRRNPPA